MCTNDRLNRIRFYLLFIKYIYLVSNFTEIEDALDELNLSSDESFHASSSAQKPMPNKSNTIIIN